MNILSGFFNFVEYIAWIWWITVALVEELLLLVHM